jgi:FkbM family methyltransferase
MASHIELANLIFKYFENDYNGVFVEIGAADPIDISVSFLFRPLDEQKRLQKVRNIINDLIKEPVGYWKIISIEPNPDFCNEFVKHNLPILEYAACAEDVGETTFKISPCPMSASALEVRYDGPHPIENGAGGWWPADTFKVINVKALKLNTILEKHHPEINHIDILLIDTEGWELEVLKGFDLEKFNPKLVLLEDACPHMITENGETISTYASYMRTHGYDLIHEELQDKFFLKRNI